MSSLFDREDIQLMQNSDLIERKNRLLKQFIDLLADQGEVLQEEYQTAFSISPPPKVNRGENYQGFPYLVMDYPRIFSQEHIFAFRTLFWWGNFISCTLHLKGDFLNDFADRIPRLIELVKDSELQFRCSIKGNEWNHDALSDEYFVPNKQITDEKMEFFKLTLIMPLQEINYLRAFLDRSHKLLLRPLI
jgi:hypothetical protein